MGGNDKAFFNTREAAEYLATNGVRRTLGTLEVLRVEGGGPRFRKDGRRVIYDKASLDDFIASRLSASVASTTEYGQGA